MTLEPANLFEVETARDEDDPPGYETPYARIGPLIGASALGASVYVLNEGNSVCPYHWEAGDEEWLLVLEGRPTLRVPEGEEELEPGDVETIRELVEEHLERTDSAVAARVLDDWEGSLARFVKVMPRDYKRALADLAAEVDDHPISTGGDGFLTTESEEAVA